MKRGSIMKKYMLENLDCPFCAAKIEEGIKNLDCVKDAKVVFATKTLMIDTDNIHKVQEAVDEIEKGVVINEQKQEESFNVKNELILLGVLLAAFGAGFYMLHIFQTPPLSYLSYAVLVIVYLIAGKDVILASIKNLRHGKIFDENFLMTFVTLAAWAIGSHEEAVGVMLFYRAGEFFQDLAVHRSRRSIQSLLEIRPDYAVVVRDGKECRVDPETVNVGETIVVKAGEKIALDGTVIKGKTTLDTRALTGESVPRGAETGDKVLSGMISLTGIIEVKVEKIFAERNTEKYLSLVDDIFSELESIEPSEGSALKRAFDYILNRKEGFLTFLKDGHIELSNNISERAIKPFVIDRKNFLFSNTENGADSSLIFFSLQQTARANGVNPIKYISELINKLGTTINIDDNLLEDLLPRKSNFSVFNAK